MSERVYQVTLHWSEVEIAGVWRLHADSLIAQAAREGYVPSSTALDVPAGAEARTQEHRGAQVRTLVAFDWRTGEAASQLAMLAVRP